MIARDVAGAPVLTVPNDAIAGGYSTLDFKETGSRFSRSSVEADNVDGEYEVERHLLNKKLTWQVYIEGANLTEIRSRHAALLDATQSGTWLLDVFEDGSTLVWTCDAADEEPPVFYPDGSRTVTLSISAKPRRGY